MIPRKDSGPTPHITASKEYPTLGESAEVFGRKSTVAKIREIRIETRKQIIEIMPRDEYLRGKGGSDGVLEVRLLICVQVN